MDLPWTRARPRLPRLRTLSCTDSQDADWPSSHGDWIIVSPTEFRKETTLIVLKQMSCQRGDISSVCLEIIVFETIVGEITVKSLHSLYRSLSPIQYNTMQHNTTPYNTTIYKTQATIYNLLYTINNIQSTPYIYIYIHTYVCI